MFKRNTESENRKLYFAGIISKYIQWYAYSQHDSFFFDEKLVSIGKPIDGFYSYSTWNFFRSNIEFFLVLVY